MIALSRAELCCSATASVEGNVPFGRGLWPFSSVAAERRNNNSHGRKPVEGISTTSQPRAKRKLDRAQPQEEGRHNFCAAPLLEAALYRACASRGAGKSLKFPSTVLRPWLWLFRRYAAMKPNGQTPAPLRG